ncbi:unnamed protein product [Caenorhabditis bovis]|uniref:Uncharacterized protein n=1 Tax=Caenorhabditis bovis TaxID=2654633 RepID=A0A8S1F558_9PELO|nr:unnamed protein product [Caenorhabditis bovis]
MSKFLKIIHTPTANVAENYANTYIWEFELKDAESSKFSVYDFLPVSAFSTNLLKNFSDVVQEGVIFEISIPEYKKITDGIDVRWFAKIIKVCGYRALARYIGASENDKSDFWVNVLSNAVHHCGSVESDDPDQDKVTYGLPFFLAERHEKDLENFIKVGQRLELVDYSQSDKLRPARIKSICGRRLNVLVTRDDYDGEWKEQPEDRQLDNEDAEYWIDQDSFFIFPVGFATFNGYELNAKREYKKHTENIAKALREGKTPPYHEKDAKPEQFFKPPIDQANLAKVKVGQKLELLDPLAVSFNSFRVASVSKILKTPGYIVVSIDDPEDEDLVPVHVTDPYLFPVGYGEKYGIKVEEPKGWENRFNWGDYLKKHKAEAMPIDLFKKEPTPERLAMFKPGSKLEAADMCENQLVCPASIKEMKGRIINVHFDGWGPNFDELYDIDSHDIFPVGWCEIHGYVLQRPEET